MTDVRGIVQQALDGALAGEGVFSYWRRRARAEGGDPDEYIVYTLGNDGADIYADDAGLVWTADVTVRYYYRDSLLDSGAGRAKAKGREAAIAGALAGAGLDVSFFDAGGIDYGADAGIGDTGFAATVFECSYSRCGP
jgi:hypothetical protein